MIRTKRHWLIVAAICAWMALRLILRSFAPQALEKVFKIEVIAHLAVLGIVITAIRNRIGWWNKPTYGDDGLLSLENSSKLAGTSYEVVPTHWPEIGLISAEVVLYIAVWAWILQP